MFLETNLRENASHTNTQSSYNQNRTVISIPSLTGIGITGRFKRLELVPERKGVAAKLRTSKRKIKLKTGKRPFRIFSISLLAIFSKRL